MKMISLLQLKLWFRMDSDDPELYVILQGLDSDDFEIYDVMLEGTIPIGTSKVLTTRENYVDKKVFEQIVGWQQN